MWYVLTVIWPALILALLAGLFLARWSHRSATKDGCCCCASRVWVPWAVLIAVLAFIVIAQLAPGRLGYVFDIALPLVIAYLIGGCIGCWIWGCCGTTTCVTPEPVKEPMRAAVDTVVAKADAVVESATAQAAVAAPVAAAPAAAAAADLFGNPSPDPAMEHEGTKPAGLEGGPRAGKADDLKRIRGVGRQNEGRLNGLGIWHFDQIAAWTHEEALWVGSYLAFPGRIEREDWIGQAKILATGGVTEFASRVDRGEVPTSLKDPNAPPKSES